MLYSLKMPHQVILSLSVLHENRRYGYLELRAVVCGTQDRLHDGVEHSEIPVASISGICRHRYRLGNALYSDVLRAQSGQRHSAWIVYEELVVPLGGLKGSGHELLKLAIHALICVDGIRYGGGNGDEQGEILTRRGSARGCGHVQAVHASGSGSAAG